MFPQLQRTVKSPTKPTHKDAKSIESENICTMYDAEPMLLPPSRKQAFSSTTN